MTKALLFLTCLLAATSGFAQHPLGIFDDHMDIGHPKLAGDASYDESTQTYNIKGAGDNIWFNRDEFQFVYKKISGDFILTADFAFTGDTAGATGHRKIGWMIRESTDEGAASANACKHIDGLVVLQWRPYHGMFMRDPEEERFYPKKGGQTIRLERIGKTITMKIAHPGEPLQLVGSCETDALQKDVLVGLYICSHDSSHAANAKVWNVRIDKPVIHEYTSNPHAVQPAPHDVLGSRLEILDIVDGTRKVIQEAPGRFEAPGYTDAPTSSTQGKFIYYNANVSGTMQIWRMHPDGSNKEQLTFDEYHNWFPHVSPDGKWIVFLSYPMDINPDEHPYYKDVMLRLIPLTAPGGPRVIAYFYGGQGTLNAPSWSPDNRHIAFVSNSEPMH
jgi:hypothetical protein